MVRGGGLFVGIEGLVGLRYRRSSWLGLPIRVGLGLDRIARWFAMYGTCWEKVVIGPTRNAASTKKRDNGPGSGYE